MVIKKTKAKTTYQRYVQGRELLLLAVVAFAATALYLYRAKHG